MYVTPQQAAQYYGVSTETLRLWADKRKDRFLLKQKMVIEDIKFMFRIIRKKEYLSFMRGFSSRKQEEDLDRQIVFFHKKIS